jgi:acyl-CoA synthetase (AMP-forming)/AMP-acid ligase II
MKLIADVYGAGADMFDMPAFPLFSLFSVAMGMTCVIPDINPSLPAHVDPQLIIDTINKYKVSFSFASPALWLRVFEYCQKHSLKLESLRKVLMAGAPVSPYLHKLLKQCAPNAEAMVPYGATEALPAATFSGCNLTEGLIDRIKRGEGYCVGKPLPGIKIRIMKPIDGSVPVWTDSLSVQNGQTGEIVIEGDIVTPQYYNLPVHTENAKINHNGSLMHRMGDMGYFDDTGNLWFKGRKAHRVFSDNKIFYPVCCEAVFNEHPKVFRSALVGISSHGKQLPLIVIEPIEGVLPLNPEDMLQFKQELKDIAAIYEHTQDIEQFLFYKPFPVDIRHNAKIFREKLKVWAQSFYNIEENS